MVVVHMMRLVVFEIRAKRAGAYEAPSQWCRLVREIVVIENMKSGSKFVGCGINSDDGW
jgi:hypothetical protein